MNEQQIGANRITHWLNLMSISLLIVGNLAQNETLVKCLS
jgi:hypothetical protein